MSSTAEKLPEETEDEKTESPSAKSPEKSPEQPFIAATRVFDRKLIDHVEVRVEAVLGDATITVGELDRMSDGAIVELDTALNQAIALRLNGKIIARGEIVSVGDKFAVRITEMAS